MAKATSADKSPVVDEVTIRSALELRDAIARAPSVLPPLGFCEVFLCREEISNRHVFLNDSDVPPGMHSQVEWAIGDNLAYISDGSAASFVSQSSLPPEGAARLLSLSLPGCPTEMTVDSVSADSLRQIYEAAAPAAFGDMNAMETRVDPLVRSGREIDAAHFSVSQDLCTWVERMWAEHFEPKNVRAEPYKINLYGPGDRFAPHRDTPQKNLVGTFLLALSGWGPPCDGGGLFVHDTGGAHHWDGASGWAAFVPYLTHEVEPVVSGARATIAFKVFANSDAPAVHHSSVDEDRLEEIADLIASFHNKDVQVGVLLSFAYSLNCTALCGRDLLIYRAMQRLGNVESIPVVVHISDSADSIETSYWFAYAYVYALTEENLSLLTSEKKTASVPDSDRPFMFFIPMDKGYAVYSNNRPPVEFAGNYADPANVDTLYVHRALILTTPLDGRRTRVRCPGASLEKVSLSGCDLRGADFSSASLRGSTLAGANLQDSDLSYAYCEQANLSEAKLCRADVTGTELEGANLEGADLTGAALCWANLRAANLSRTILADVKWDYETTWPDGFDPIQHGAGLPVELVRALRRNTNERLCGNVSEPAGTITNSLGMKFVPIPAGEFLMGTPGDQGEEVQHRVRITKPFLLGMHQVTQAEYEKLTGENPSLFKGPILPVEHLSWPAAARFCQLLSARPEEQRAGRRYRLPTEAEWEYACRAGTTSPFNTGDTLEDDQAHFASGDRPAPKHTVPVGSYPPNAWGLFDMHGNVWEWTSDWFSADYYKESPVDDPQGPPTGTHHTLRGGSASVQAHECRSACRGEAAAVDGPESASLQRFALYGDFGIRVVCDMD